MSSNKDQTSTLQGYVDQATGAVQSALGSLTGSTADKVCHPFARALPPSATPPHTHTDAATGARREPQDGRRSRERSVAHGGQSRTLHRVVVGRRSAR
jgi:hypothetical protein